MPKLFRILLYAQTDSTLFFSMCDFTGPICFVVFKTTYIFLYVGFKSKCLYFAILYFTYFARVAVKYLLQTDPTFFSVKSI